jgi:DNA-binding NarL/FixJ family response regulator
MKGEYVPIDVILADDHEIFRDGFAVMVNKIPDINLVGQASNGEELLQLIRELKPDVIVTDIKMPVMDGIEATKQIRKEFPNLGIIAFSMFDEDNLIVDMLEAGAKGYLLKNAQKEEIIAAIKTVHKGEPYYCRETTHKLAEMIANSNFNPAKKNAGPEFSEREIAIIRLICEEYTNKQIAEMLDLSKRTIEDYREKILEKIDAKNSAGIVVYAIRNKIF